MGPLALLVAPLLVLVSVWLPLVGHYRVAEMTPTAAMVESARTAPGDDLLQELRRFYLLPIAGRSTAFEVSAAEEILQGRLEIPGLPVGQLRHPPAPDDLGRLPARLQLLYAGFVVPDLLLAAYVDTGRETFFASAKTFIESWDRYERQSLGPEGLLWNDHAIAARVRVLAEFWRIYRVRPDYRPDVGRAVLAQAARYGSLLSSPEQFTFATNHGIMQNLGLLMLILSFPSLPDRERYHQVALNRLGGQLAFLIDEAGVVRENSAGYQAFDLAVLAMTYRCMSLLGDPIPDDWARRYVAGLAILDSLRRPDGTIPTTGDTDEAPLGGYPPTTQFNSAGQAGPLHPFTSRLPAAPETLDAATGYWIDWAGLGGWPDAASQTVVTWTSPPGPGHKHADELGVMAWSAGVSWLTSVGYWPYADASGLLAESWVGSNAPHLVDEASTSSRQTALLGHGHSDRVAAVDLERVGPGTYRVRRQVVRVGDLWIVLDAVTGSDAASQSTWTISPDVDLRPAGSTGGYLLKARTGPAARIDFVGSPKPVVATYEGSLAPFAGWHVVGGTPQPAPAVVVEQPAGPAWLATVVARTDGFDPEDRVTGRPTAARFDSAEDWSMTVPTADGGLEVRRAGDRISVSRPGSSGASSGSVDLAPGPDVRPEQARIRAAFDAMAADYPQFQPQISRRTIVTSAILFLALGQAAVLLVVRRLRRSLYPPLGALAGVCWVGLAVWLWLVVLRSWEVVHLAS